MNTQTPITFGAKLRETREALGLSQNRLGILSEIGANWVNAIERGKRSPGFLTATRIAKGLGVPLVMLVRGTDLEGKWPV